MYLYRRRGYFALEEGKGVNSPRSVLLSVSGANPTLNHPPSSSPKAVTVRHAPLTAIESPMEQSPRMAEAEANVSVKPWPSAESWGVSDLRIARCSIWSRARQKDINRSSSQDFRSESKGVSKTYEACEHG